LSNIGHVELNTRSSAIAETARITIRLVDRSANDTQDRNTEYDYI